MKTEDKAKVIAGIVIAASMLGGLVLYAMTQRVPAGYRGVIVNLYGSDKGISEQSVGVGRYLLGWNREMYLFPTFLQNRSWAGKQAITMQTSEGLTISTDAGITYQIQPDNVVKVFSKYRLGIDEITDTFLHNIVRDAMNEVASRMTVDQIYGIEKERFIAAVNDIVILAAKDNGINVDKIYLIGSFDLPQMVKDSIDVKIQASQNAVKVQNEIATSRAQAQKTIVEAEAHAKQIMIKAEAQSKANTILAQSLTPEFVQYQAILRWNGILPTTNAGGVIPMINLGKSS